MKTFIHFIKQKTALLLLISLSGVLTLNSCQDEWESSISEIEAGKTTLHIQTKNKADGTVMPNVKVSVFSKPRGHESAELVFEGRSDAEGNLEVPDFDVPNQAQVQMTDSRYPPVGPMAVKVLSENSASIVLEVSKVWTEANIYDRTNFEVLAVSSQNGSSAGSNALLDDTATWHTQYSPVLQDFPHWLILDMKEEKAVHGFALKQRRNNNGPIKGVEFYVSDDNQNWTKVLGEDIPYTNPGTWHVLVLDEETTGRYVKFVVTSGYIDGTTFINLEQLGVF